MYGTFHIPLKIKIKHSKIPQIENILRFIFVFKINALYVLNFVHVNYWIKLHANENTFNDIWYIYTHIHEIYTYTYIYILTIFGVHSENSYQK